MNQDSLWYFNGIDGDTGSYDLPPMTAQELMRVARGEVPPDNINELRFRHQQATAAVLGPREGIDPTRLEESGWGIIFPEYGEHDVEQRKQIAAIHEALQPLIELRNQSTGSRFEEWVRGQGKEFRVGRDTKNAYLARHGVGPGPANPDHVPYYLLIVGSPADIPFRFQSQLDVQYAVGRIHFQTVQEYSDYAASVVAVERSQVQLPRRATFFGVANPDDPATALSASALIQPLAHNLALHNSDWSVETVLPEQATKACLNTLLGGPQTPTLLFSASHGMRFEPGSDRQIHHQGALLCQDWPGPRQWPQNRPIPQDFYYAGDDLTSSSDLLGLIACFFACYAGGTPQYNEYAHWDSMGATRPPRTEIATQPFLANLPTRMLGRSRGALAVVAHVDRTWSFSFRWDQAGTQTTVFDSVFQRLLQGHPIGSALEYVNQRYAELATMLNDELEEIEFGRTYDPFQIAGLWTANNDARGYAIIGDPAVRLPCAADPTRPVERQSIPISHATR